ncbi:MAG: MFS transporter [Anaerolineae bacterium]
MRLPTNRLFWAVSFGHMTNDMIMSMRTVVLTFMSAYVLPMTGQQIGIAVSAIELSGALSQPFFGQRADRTGGRWLGAGGILWTATLMMTGLVVATVTGNYLLMLVPMALAGLGSAAFHPVGSMHATDVDPMRAGRNAALFFMCGQLGLAISPALTGLLLNNAHSNLHEYFGSALGGAAPIWIERGTVLPVFILGLFVIPPAIWMATTLPRLKGHKVAQATAVTTSENTGKSTTPSRRVFLVLGMAIAFRSLAHLSTVNFLPYIFQQKGWLPAEYGFITGIFWVASAIAGIWFGHLGDRYDIRRVVLLSLLVAVPPIFLLPDLNGIFAILAALLIGASSGAHSIIVVLAQNLLPGRKGFASGAVLGFIFGSGAVGNLIVGSLIDRFDPATTYHIIALVTLLTCGLWLLLPVMNQKSHRPNPNSETFLDTLPETAG